MEGTALAKDASSGPRIKKLGPWAWKRRGGTGQGHLGSGTLVLCSVLIPSGWAILGHHTSSLDIGLLILFIQKTITLLDAYYGSLI